MILLRRRASGPPARDRGSITMYTVLLAPVVLLLAGLLVDGGLAIHARQRADDIAEQAARAGANDIDEATLRRTGKAEIKTATACRKAMTLLASYRQITGSPNCSAAPQQVTVTVHITVQSRLLGIIGINAFNMQGTASAHPDEGN